MERFFAGLDFSKDETAICVRSEDGTVVTARKASTDPDAILEVLKGLGSKPVRMILETGRMANWLHGELARRDPPAICVDARQAHAVLSQMHNKTDANDAAMLAGGRDSLSMHSGILRVAFSLEDAADDGIKAGAGFHATGTADGTSY
ncbi:IS110 family transposase [Acuticoccus sediminis]|uniref:IS110 family transposase n=1 Tax=Acuticoccus sediminis TaxID=2184697 RepID=UPI001CFE0A84|nr:transposase [Acuticoccus sediminis]